MKYERLTDRKTAEILKNTECESWDSDLAEAYRYIRLAELEDKIEDGTALLLPCKVGDTVYRLLGKCDGYRCPYNGDYGQWRCSYKGERRCNAFVDEIPFELSHLADIGVHIFWTREEAEARLKKVESGKRK